MGQVVDLMVQVGVADTVCVCVGAWGGAQAPPFFAQFSALNRIFSDLPTIYRRDSHYETAS
jgi:hypothetical protein